MDELSFGRIRKGYTIMKKLTILLTILLTSILLTGCGYTEVPTSYISADYFATNSVEELVDYAQYVYEGKVTRVYFGTFNERTGVPDKNGGGDNPTAQFYTVYEIEVTATYKGEEKEKRTIQVMGGTDEYGLEEQYRVLNSANIQRRQVFSDFLTLSVGKTYIFFTLEGKGEHEIIFSPTQYAVCSEGGNEIYAITYNKVKNYVTKEEFLNPSEVPTTYVSSQPMLTTPSEIAQSGEAIYTGIVHEVKIVIVDGKLHTRINVSVLENYKGKCDSYLIDIEGGTDDYDVKEQYRQLNKAGIEERTVYENLITPEQNKVYIFVTNSYGEDVPHISTVKNPAQYAFCIDDSNAPGGVNYSKMREYLLKNYEMQESRIKKYFMED